MKGSSHGTGADVAVDAFVTGRTLAASPGLIYTWGIGKASSASGGAYALSDEGTSTASFIFRGTAVEWDTILGPSMGRARIYIDGVLRTSTDNYAAATTYVARLFSERGTQSGRPSFGLALERVLTRPGPGRELAESRRRVAELERKLQATDPPVRPRSA